MPTSRLLWWGALAALACGILLCVLGWYGVSGERVAERQLPYLASSTVPGAALLVVGAVLAVGSVREAREAREEAAGQDAEGPRDRVGRPAPEAPRETGAHDPPAAVSEEPPVRVPGGRLAHRPDCPLVAGKPIEPAEPAGPADAAGAVADGGGSGEPPQAGGDGAPVPCPVCEPWTRPWPR
ncbi:hypothetical protein ABZ705_28595 [Streptomyces sp. NPDC006984]|uniref:hypothetical protein n=1 Tax=Streptomyces sp. NPDC006984 TaxID=3155463 RepID=UPI0033D88061